jgi:plasmid maintenance system antidote protein VapI
MRFKNSFARFMGAMLMAEAGDGGDGAAPPTAPPATSVLGTAAGTDFIPEKYRTTKEDGTIDMEASARKLAESYTSLEKRMGSGDAPPKTVEEYAPTLTVEGVTWDEFKTDPQAQEFLKGAHEAGLTNKQLAYVVDAFHKAAPELLEGNAALTTQDCTAALKAVWTDEKAMMSNVQASYRAAQAFASEGQAPGNLDALMAKYGNDPDFIAFTANIGKELKEDTAINGGGAVSDGDFAVKTSELRQQLQDLPAHDPKRPGIQAQLDEMYNQRYNRQQSRLG